MRDARGAQLVEDGLCARWRTDPGLYVSLLGQW